MHDLARAPPARGTSAAGGGTPTREGGAAAGERSISGNVVARCAHEAIQPGLCVVRQGRRRPQE
jgi:hypothetical protein